MCEGERVCVFIQASVSVRVCVNERNMRMLIVRMCVLIREST